MFKTRAKRRFLSLGITIIFLLTQIFSIQVFAVTTPGLGEMLYQESVTFAPGAALNTYVTNHASLPQEREQVFTMEFKPSDQNIKLLVNSGDKVCGTNTLTKYMNMTRDEGYSVIGGINGDFFDIAAGSATGAPTGFEIHEGRLRTAGGIATFETIGFTASGEAMISSLKIDISLRIQKTAEKWVVNRFNKSQDTAICIYDENFSGTTRGSEPSLNLICDITEGIPTVNGTTTLNVSEIVDNTENIAIPAGKMVIALADNTNFPNRLASLKKVAVGDTLYVDFKDKNTASRWGEVKEAVSGRPLLRNGAIVQGEKATDVHPRTSIGLKPDGTMVIFVVDGRQPGYSGGLNLIDIANYMISQGCNNGINLDGGGSTTIATRLPGDTMPTILNRPSDGGERSVGNALILVSNVTGDGNLANLHINPVKSIMLAGASTNFTVKGTDNAYQPVTLPGTPVWKVNGGIGTIDSNGRFTSGTLGGSGSVEASIGGKTAKADIQTVDNADLKFNVTELYMNPGDSFDLDISATWNGIPVATADNAFNWTVEGNIGTVDSNGMFKAASGTGLTGKVKASHGVMSCEVNVNIGKEPVIIEDFEDGIVGWSATDANLPDENVKIFEETSEDFVRFGNKSLKLMYDMANGSSTTVGAYVDAVPAVIIDGYPTHIGMWVYGDNKKHWLRGQLLDGDDNAFYVDFTTSGTGVNWEGWKYVEAPIPAGKTMPLKVDMPVRYMETSKDNVTSGVLYVDNIRAVYGYRNDDLTPPVFGAISPADGSAINSYTNISVQVSDNRSGINPTKIKYFIDGQPITDFIYNAEAGSIQWNTHDFTEGKHKFTVIVKDNFGNEAVKEWYITYDRTPPITEAAIDKAETNGWYNSNITLTLTAKDNTQESCKTEYRLDAGSQWLTYTSPVSITNEGKFTIQYRSTDRAGNQEAIKEKKVQIDKTPPSYTLESVNDSVYSVNNGSVFEDYRKLVFKTSDGLSGLKSASITINNLTAGGANTYSIDPLQEPKVEIDFEGRVGSYKAVISAADIAGNNLQQEILFSVTTSISSVNNLMTSYQASNDLTGPMVPQLENSLKQAEFFVNQTRKTTDGISTLQAQASENYKQAIKHMQDFIKHLNNPALKDNISEKARQVLNADAEAMIKMWSK